MTTVTVIPTTEESLAHEAPRLRGFFLAGQVMRESVQIRGHFLPWFRACLSFSIISLFILRSESLGGCLYAIVPIIHHDAP